MSEEIEINTDEIKDSGDKVASTHSDKDPTVEVSDIAIEGNQTNNEKNEVEDEEASLHVGNLTRNVKAAHIEEIFGSYGAVKNVDLQIDARVGLSKGYAYVTFEKSKDAEQAVLYLDGGQIDGNEIKVSFVLVSTNKRRRDSPDRAPVRSRRSPSPQKATSGCATGVTSRVGDRVDRGRVGRSPEATRGASPPRRRDSREDAGRVDDRDRRDRDPPARGGASGGALGRYGPADTGRDRSPPRGGRGAGAWPERRRGPSPPPFRRRGRSPSPVRRRGPSPPVRRRGASRSDSRGARRRGASPPVRRRGSRSPPARRDVAGGGRGSGGGGGGARSRSRSFRRTRSDSSDRDRGRGSGPARGGRGRRSDSDSDSSDSSRSRSRSGSKGSKSSASSRSRSRSASSRSRN